MAFIIATCTQTVRDLFRPVPWVWVAVARRADLPAYFAAAIGGIAFFFLIYSVPILVVVGLAAGINAKLGLLASTLFLLIPAAGAPILLGRLCGAFVNWHEAAPSTSAVLPSSAALPDDEVEARIQRNVAVRQQAEQGAVQSSAAAPAHSAVEGLSIDALPDDPTDDFIRWTRTTLTGLTVIDAAFVFSDKVNGAAVFTLGLVLKGEARLGDRQAALRDVTAAIAAAPGAPEKRRVILLEGALIQRVNAVGLRIYQSHKP